MSGNLLGKYTGRAEAGTSAPIVEEPPETDVTDDFGTFGWLRGIRDRAQMLELRKKDGTIKALPYQWFESVQFDPSDGITLMVMGKPIRIKGRNLNAEVRPTARLFEGITRHRVPWLQQADEATQLAAGEAATVIDDIQW